MRNPKQKGIASLCKDVTTKDSNLIFINYLANRELMKGYPDKNFHPLAKVTRAGSQVPEEVKESTTINAGDLVTSGAASSAEVNFPDGTGLFIKEKTRILFKESRGRSYIKSDGTSGTAVEWLAVELKAGKIFGALATNYEATDSKPEPKAKQVSLSGQENVFSKLSQGTFKILAAAGVTTVTDKKAASSAVDLKGGQSTAITQPDAPPVPPAPMTIKDKQEWVQTQVWAQERALDIQTNKETTLQPVTAPLTSVIFSDITSIISEALEKIANDILAPTPVQETSASDPSTPTVGVNGVTLDKYALVLKAGGISATLKANVFPDTASNQGVTWNSSNPAVATVTNGVVTPKAAGTATITVKTNDGSHKDTATVTVINNSAWVAVTGIALNKSRIYLYTGGSPAILVPEFSPGNVSNRGVIWSSSNRGVATVSEGGVVTPIAPGTATITVTSEDGGFTTTCDVTVGNPT
ncbi:MAG: Ig-like domain-containing protein [Carboxydocellales bacterium]